MRAAEWPNAVNPWIIFSRFAEWKVEPRTSKRRIDSFNYSLLIAPIAWLKFPGKTLSLKQSPAFEKRRHCVATHLANVVGAHLPPISQCS
jgi:hypothetical protein